jgi:hypothetical protein
MVEGSGKRKEPFAPRNNEPLQYFSQQFKMFSS